MGPRTPGGRPTYSLPGARDSSTRVGSGHVPELEAAVDRVAPQHRFDSTRGFPGEGPSVPVTTPWFLEDSSIRNLIDRKRHRSSAPPDAPSFPPARGQLPSTGRRLSFEDHNGLTRVRTHTRSADGPPAPNSTPVPQELPLQVRDFATPREQRDFLTPLPSVPAGKSLRQAFIKHFGGLRGMDPASFDEVWKVAKNGYNLAHDAHFLRFQTDFLTHSDLPRFNPTGIQPGDLVGFLRREHERGAAHPSLKDASASVSTACAQASDGLAQLGSQASVVSYLKYVKQSEAPDRKERMITYPDVARLIQIAWAAGPNDNLSLDQLKRKLVILLMVDTAARPSDLWRLYRTTVGKYRQIEFVGESDVRIRYFWPKEVDPFSSRTNATNTWFSQWVLIRGTTPQSTDTVACLRDFLGRSSDPDRFASEFIPQLAASVQPLIFARQVDGVFQKCSVDHISVIVKKAIAQAQMAPMKPRHLRGASTLKIVLLSPDAMSVAMGLGRWTTSKTFLQHYNAPVELNDASPCPETIQMHGQQLLRWGWSPKPPTKVTVDEYDEAFTFWVGRSIPRLGRIKTFDDGKYTVAKRHVSHADLMDLISKARTNG